MSGDEGAFDGAIAFYRDPRATIDEAERERIRDQFALAALPQLLAATFAADAENGVFYDVENDAGFRDDTLAGWAKDAYDIADAMLAERSRRGQ